VVAVDDVLSLVVVVVDDVVIVLGRYRDYIHMPVLDRKEVAQIDPGTEVRVSVYRTYDDLDGNEVEPEAEVEPGIDCN
jgi:hypothetical protein